MAVVEFKEPSSVFMGLGGGCYHIEADSIEAVRDVGASCVLFLKSGGKLSIKMDRQAMQAAFEAAGERAEWVN